MAVDHIEKPPLLALVGPTAVGKSALALRCAARLSGEIISADSAQVYRYLDIGTAKPTPAEQALVPHHLLDLVNPDQDFSAADYQSEAKLAIEKVLKRGKLPILVGGTGLYVRAITEGYAFGERGKSPLRENLARQAQQEGLASLYRRLEALDPQAASKIHPNDQRRIIRALEVYHLEGKPISRQLEETARGEPAYNLLCFGLNRPRELLYHRIEERVDTMLQQGFLKEVQSILKKGYGPESPGLQILGYRQLVDYINNDAIWDETVENIKKQTRRLAKRQGTWFRKEQQIFWLEVEEKKGLDPLEEIIYKKVKEILPFQANIII